MFAMGRRFGIRTATDKGARWQDAIFTSEPILPLPQVRLNTTNTLRRRLGMQAKGERGDPTPVSKRNAVTSDKVA